MKQVLLLILVIITCSTTQAQDRTALLAHSYQSVVKIKPLAFFQGSVPYSSEISILGEWSMDYHKSVQLGFSFYTEGPDLGLIVDSVSGLPIANYSLQGLGFEGQYRYYLERLSGKIKSGNTCPLGVYTGLHVAFANVRARDELNFSITEEVVVTHVEAALLLGIQHRIFDRVLLDLGLQAGYKNYDWTYIDNMGQYTEIDTSDDLGEYYASPFLLGAQFTIGYGFY